jgi:hypothetical protein
VYPIRTSSADRADTILNSNRDGTDFRTHCHTFPGRDSYDATTTYGDVNAGAYRGSSRERSYRDTCRST